ncbi:hypothetical protein [Halorientalis salina]|uniref:hypothetical protein n=1 Tax=Halorientalis salina TaxID=2932266 RepID=UPI0010AB58C9|nr:hypothetical protein [Halorientalis salina]
MFTDRLRRASYGWLLVQGLAAALAPKRSIETNLKLWGVPFENVDAVEPKSWYVDSTRAVGIGMIATGVAGLLFEREDESSNDD